MLTVDSYREVMNKESEKIEKAIKEIEEELNNSTKHYKYAYASGRYKAMLESAKITLEVWGKCNDGY